MVVENVCSGMLPDVAEKSRPAKMPLTQPRNDVESHAAKGYDAVVDYAVEGCLAERVGTIGRVIALFGDTVEDWTEKDVVCLSFPFSRFSYGMA